MKKYTSIHMLNDQEIRQERRSFHSNNQPNFHEFLPQSQSVRSTLSKGYTWFRKHAHVTILRGERPLSSLSMTSGCIHLLPKLTIGKGLSSWLAEQEDRGSIPGHATWIFRDWLSSTSKSRYGWKIAKSTLILKTTNQPTLQYFDLP